MMNLGEKLQQLRKSKGLSQEQLAVQITVSRQAVSKWELGESVPDIDNVVQLSKLFSVSTDYLLNDEMEESATPTAQVSAASAGNKFYNLKVIPIILFAIALAVALIGWKELQLFWPLLIGLVIEAVGIIYYELITLKGLEVKQAQEKRKQFYSYSVWLALPLPIAFILFGLMNLLPMDYFSYSDEALQLIGLGIYFVASFTISRRLRNLSAK